MSNHTPGPWIYSQKFREIHDSSVNSPSLIAEIPEWIDEAKEEQEANARLIAAAPETAVERDRLKALNAEMLSALKGLGCVCLMKIGHPQVSEHSPECQAVAKAIEEAEGEKP